MASCETVKDLEIFVRKSPPTLSSSTQRHAHRSETTPLSPRLKAAHPCVHAPFGTHVSALPEESLKNSEARFPLPQRSGGDAAELIRKWPDWWSRAFPAAISQPKPDASLAECPYTNLDAPSLSSAASLPNDDTTLQFFRGRSRSPLFHAGLSVEMHILPGAGQKY